MPDSTAQSLLDQYTSKIKADPRVFSKDVMSQDQFDAPFKAWTKNYIDTYMLPEFLRYQYNPYVQQAGAKMQNANQQVGLSGAWRNAQSGVDLSNTADELMRGQEQLTTGFNDQALQTQDALKQAWSDPLYQSQMTNFYNAPWRNINTGDVNPILTPTDPRLVGFQPNSTMSANPQSSPITPFQGNQSLTNQYQNYPMSSQTNLTQNGQANINNPALDIGGNPRNLISQYLKKPQVNNTNSYNILGGL